MIVTTVFFDVYNTLAGFNPSREEIQRSAASRFSLSLTSDGLNRGYHKADAMMAKQNAVKPLRSMSHSERDHFFALYEQTILRESGKDVDLEIALNIWHEVRRHDYKLELFEDVLPVLEFLRKKGLNLAVISNMGQTGEALVKTLGLKHHIEIAVTAMEAGAEKPHPAIFQIVMQRLDVKPSQTVHVGDQLESDVLGSLNAGIQPVLMDRYRGHTNYTDHPRIENLKELPRTLELFG